MAGAAGSFDEQVEDFIRTIAVPRRLREPRRAARFEAVDPVIVPTRWGDVAAWREGDGPAVLLVHGWEDDSSLWSPLIDALVVRGRPVVAFDLPAHGASTGEWAVSFEGTDAIKEIDGAPGPLDAVVAHSAGCGVTIGAIGEGWDVARAAFIAPAVSTSGRSRWARKAEQLGVPDDVAAEAEARYHRAHGPARAAWRSGPAYESLDIDSLVVQSRDDEHNDVGAVERVFTDHPRARLVLVDGLAHRRTARDQVVVDLLADFLTDPA
jgi:pimeloyl-ACP methyl ester carboxylesterase